MIMEEKFGFSSRLSHVGIVEDLEVVGSNSIQPVFFPCLGVGVGASRSSWNNAAFSLMTHHVMHVEKTVLGKECDRRVMYYFIQLIINIQLGTMKVQKLYIIYPIMEDCQIQINAPNSICQNSLVLYLKHSESCSFISDPTKLNFDTKYGIQYYLYL